MAKKNKTHKNKQKAPARSNKKVNANQAMEIKLSRLEGYLPVITLFLVCVLLFYPPFFQGLYFKHQMFATHIFTGIVMMLVVLMMWIKKERTFINGPLDWTMLALALAYLIAMVDAIHPGDAYYGFLTALNYFAIYWIVSRVVRDFRDIETVARVLLASAVGVAVIGILAALGLSDYRAAFDGRVIASTLQYTNTTGAYLAAATLIAAGLWTREKNLLIQMVYLLSGIIMNLVILATMSKGAWLIVLLGALLLLFGMPGIEKLKALYGLGLSVVGAQALFTKFYPAVVNGTPGATRYLFIGLGVAAIGLAVWWLIEYLYEKKGAIITGLFIVAMLSFPVWFLGSSITIDENILTEASELLDKENNSFVARSDFYRWGWEIVKDYPVNGIGAGGWNALYHQYQDYLIFTTNPHNHFLQVWIETGTIGFIAWISILCIFLYYLWVLRKSRERSEWILLWGLSSAVLALITHSLIDFDFCFPALVIFSWAIIAVISAAYNKDETGKSSPGIKITGIVIVCVTALTLLLAGLICWAGYSHAAQGMHAMKQMETAASQEENKQLYSRAVDSYTRAVSLDSHSADYRAELAYLHAIKYGLLEKNQPGSGQAMLPEILALIKETNRLQPYEIKINNRLMLAAAELNHLTVTRQVAEKALQANPYDRNAYTLIADTLWQGMNEYKKVGDEKKAKEYARELTQVQQQIELQQQKVNPERRQPAIMSGLEQATLDKIQDAREYLGE